MPFPSTLSAGQITQVQKATQHFEHYLLVNPNAIVWQAQVNENITATTYAEFDWTNTLQGVRTDVEVGQVVLITTSQTDFNDPVLRGRIRNTIPDATTVYINESAVDITTSMYVTVIDDYEIAERLQRADDEGNIFKDWDEQFTRLPPTVDGLPSVAVDLSGSATTQFTDWDATATAHAEGASIIRYSWDIADGSFINGTVSTQANPDVQFDATATTHRWVSVEVRDDNGNITIFHMEVYTLDPRSDSESILPVESLNISASTQDGYNATITPFSDFDRATVLDQTRCTIVSVDDYDGTTTPITSNIMMVGRLRTESSATQGDGQHSTSQTSSLQVEGFGTLLGRLPAPALAIADVDSPTKWGEIEDPDPTRAIVYFLAFHTTAITLMSIDFEDLSAYTYGDWRIEEPTAIENIVRQADSANAAPFFAPDGIMAVQRKIAYLSSSDRSGITAIYDFVTGDIVGIDSLEEDYRQSIGEIRAGAVTYSTSLKDAKYRFVARAPSTSFGQGHESTQLDGQVLTADDTESNARTEIASRAANHLRYVNSKVNLSCTLMDGFYWLVPNLYQRYSFTLAATDTIRGQVYTSSDYWQLTGISYTATQNERVVSREVSATFEEEVIGENAGISVALVPDPANFTVPIFSQVSGYFDFPADPLTYYPTDTPENTISIDTSFLEPYPPDVVPAPEPNSEVLKVNMRSGAAVSTTNNTTPGETYTITVRNDGSIGGVENATSPTNVDTFTVNANQSAYTNGTYVTDANLEYYVDVEGTVRYDGTPTHRRSAQWTTLNGNWGDRTRSNNVQFNDTTKPVSDNPNFNTNHIYRFSRSGDGAAVGLRFFDIAYGDNSGSWTINVYEISIRGDAFYKGYNYTSPSAYTGTNGLTIDGAKPSPLPGYSASHEYTFTETGTGSPFSFQFGDTDLTDNSATNLRVTVKGPGMGYS